MMFRALTLNHPAGTNSTPNRGEQSVCGGVKFLQRLLFVGLVLAISLTGVLSFPEDGAAATGA